MRGFELCSQGGLPDLQHRCRASAEFTDFELALLDFLRQLDPTNNPDSGSETLQPQHRTKPLLQPAFGLRPIMEPRKCTPPLEPSTMGEDYPCRSGTQTRTRNIAGSWRTRSCL